jgi:hypothetical protein
MRVVKLGGHPTPEGARALIGTPAESREFIDEVLRSELCHPGANIWRNAVLGGRAFDNSVVPDSTGQTLDQALQMWVDTDGIGKAWSRLIDGRRS